MKAGSWVGGGGGPKGWGRELMWAGVGFLKKIPVEEAGGGVLGVEFLADDF
jgi:hypothetical protein